MSTFGERLRQARKECGLSLEQMAEIVGVARQNIAAYENGSKQPELQRVPILANAVSRSVGWLFGEDLAPQGDLGRIEQKLDRVLTMLQAGQVYEFFPDAPPELKADDYGNSRVRLSFEPGLKKAARTGPKSRKGQEN